MGSAIKIALLTGAIKNAGDYLITNRSIQLLKAGYPDCEINSFNRLFHLGNQIDEINANDILIFAGGPGYIPGIYPQYMPLVDNLSDIKIPMFILGMGWHGNDSLSATVYSYQLTGKAVDLMKRVQSDTEYLGCRDWYSVNILRNSGIYAGVMTGCPAWYNLDYVNQLSFNKEIRQGINKICISDPAKVNNIPQAVKLVKYLKSALPKAELKFIFHRGIEADQYTPKEVSDYYLELKKDLEKMGCESTNIAFSHNGFEEYDDCDLHIGFRVHAHIYNLSRRNLSILIEEDGRGAGVNNALGLEHITAYDYGLNASNQMVHVENSYLEYQVDDYINNLWNSSFLQVENAFTMMNKYYAGMRSHIESIKKYI